MWVDEVVAFFGSKYKVCKMLGIERQNGTQWKHRGYIPYEVQIKIQELTNGELMANEAHVLKKPMGTPVRRNKKDHKAL